MWWWAESTKEGGRGGAEGVFERRKGGKRRETGREAWRKAWTRAGIRKVVYEYEEQTDDEQGWQSSSRDGRNCTSCPSA